MMKQRDKQRISMALSTAQLASPLIGMPAFAPLVELTKQAFASLPEDSTTRPKHTTILLKISRMER